MPRYLIERAWDERDEREMDEAGYRSRHIAEKHFPAITWEHSHVVSDDSGKIKTFCVYTAPNVQMVLDHAGMVGDHRVVHVYEIGGDVSPADFPG